MTTPVYIEIAVPTPLRQGFTYAIATAAGELDFGDGENDEGTPLPGTPLPGTRFYIQFGRQKLVGIMLRTVSTPDLPAHKIRAVIRQLDATPVFPVSIVTLCRWAAEYYHHPVGEVFSSALPRLLRDGQPLETSERILTLGENPATIQRAPRQTALQ